MHGWPGSVVEFLDVLGPLTDPTAHGGAASDAFHVVAPSLPGFGFSGPTHERGWHPRRIAEAFVQLMADLGFDRYGAQGGDWGSIVTANVADLVPDRVAGLHLNFVTVSPPKDGPPLTDEEQARFAQLLEWRKDGAGYQEIQGTRPQTLGYGLEDSPAGLCAWIVEKFRAWSDTRRRPRAVVRAGSAARQHHALLGDRHGDLVVPHLLGDAPGRQGRDPAGVHRRADGHRLLSGRDHEDAARAGSSSATTSCTGPSRHAAATSPRWRSPTCSSTTCAQFFRLVR